MMELSIVTACHNYGRYLDAWADSIIGMTRRPVMVGIVDAGSTDDTRDLMHAAAMKLEAAGLRVRTLHIDSGNIGVGRNAAVSLADSEWVQHLDCDDMAMPHMLEEFELYHREADVIGAGYERTGNLAAGPRNPRRIYSSHQGEQTRRSKAPASGVSPFRRSLWERSPYREDMIGGWDTALWLGFSHLDPPARFVATRRPVFYYRQHADSVFNERRKSARRSALVGRKLMALRNGYRGVSVLVPWKPDGGPRDRAWEWIRDRYAAVHPEYEVVVGQCSGPEWRKGEAVADALSRATGWTLVIADADCIVAPPALRDAVAITETQPEVGWVIPHRNVLRIDDAPTREIVAGPPTRADFAELPLQRKAYEGYAGGGMLVIERSRYEAAGGIPTVFRGWGAEDEALAVILDTLIGPHARLEHDLVHLYHPQERRFTHARYQANRALFHDVLARDGQPSEMWELVQAWADGLNPHDKIPNGRRVRMVALEACKVGTRFIQRGATFFASPEQARRMLAASTKRVAITRNGHAQLAAIESREALERSGRNGRPPRAPARSPDEGIAVNLTRSDYV